MTEAQQHNGRRVGMKDYDVVCAAFLLALVLGFLLGVGACKG